MKKEFYIVVPIDEIQDSSVRDLSFMWSFKNFWASINQADDVTKIKSQIKNVTKLKKWLVQRSNIIKTSLEAIWIRASELDKNELVKFLHDYYNPTLESFNSIKTASENYNLI